MRRFGVFLLLLNGINCQYPPRDDRPREQPQFSPNTPFSSPDSLPRPVFGEGFVRGRSPPAENGPPNRCFNCRGPPIRPQEANEGERFRFPHDEEGPRRPGPEIPEGVPRTDFQRGPPFEPPREDPRGQPPPHGRVVGVNMQMVAGFYPQQGYRNGQQGFRGQEQPGPVQPQRGQPYLGVPAGGYPQREFSQDGNYRNPNYPQQGFREAPQDGRFQGPQGGYPPPQGGYPPPREGYRRPEDQGPPRDGYRGPEGPNGPRDQRPFSPLEGPYPEQPSRLRPGSEPLGNPYPKNEGRSREYEEPPSRRPPPPSEGPRDGYRNRQEEEESPEPSGQKFFLSPYSPYKQTLPEEAYYGQEKPHQPQQPQPQPPPFPPFPQFQTFPGFAPFNPFPFGGFGPNQGAPGQYPQQQASFAPGPQQPQQPQGQQFGAPQPGGGGRYPPPPSQQENRPYPANPRTEPYPSREERNFAPRSPPGQYPKEEAKFASGPKEEQKEEPKRQWLTFPTPSSTTEAPATRSPTMKLTDELYKSEVVPVYEVILTTQQEDRTSSSTVATTLSSFPSKVPEKLIASMEKKLLPPPPHRLQTTRRFDRLDDSSETLTTSG